MRNHLITFWMRPDATARGLGDVDSLGVYKLFDAVDGTLPSVAAFLDAAKGKARIGAHGFVDEDAATLNPFGSDAFAALQVAGDDAAAQPKRRIVGSRNRLLLVLDGNYGGDRPEELFLISRHPPTDIGQHRRRIVGTRVGG